MKLLPAGIYTLSDPQATMSGAGFGSITSAADPRIGQLALKLRF